MEVERDPETTSEMMVDELQRLVETTRPVERQRITAEIAVPTLDDLLKADENAVVVRSPEGPPPVKPGSGTWVEPSRTVVAVSFLVTLLLGIATGLMIW